MVMNEEVYGQMTPVKVEEMFSGKVGGNDA
jgi:hypothetical protein